MGDIIWQSANEPLLKLKDVRYALDMHLNLTSMGKLNDERYCNTFGNGQWRLSKGLMIVAHGKKCINNLNTM